MVFHWGFHIVEFSDSLGRSYARNRDMTDFSTRSPAKTFGTQSIHRAAQILREIATRDSTGLRLIDVSERTGLEPSTTHRILMRLIEEGLVIRDARTRRYSLGPLTYELGLAAASRYDLRGLCQPSLERLAEASGDTVFLNIRSGFDAVCVDRMEGWFPIKTLVYQIGSRRPLGVGAGSLALMLSLPEDEIDQIATVNASRLSGYGNLNGENMVAALRRSQLLGYGLTEDLAVPGVSAVAVALRNGVRQPYAAISIAAISSRMPDARKDELVRLLRAEAHELEKTLRGRRQAA